MWRFQFPTGERGSRRQAARVHYPKAPLINPPTSHKPKGDAAYRLVTEGSIPADDKDYPTPQDFDRSGWKPAVSPCASAYVGHHQRPSTAFLALWLMHHAPSTTDGRRYKQLKGTEPLYTNWARTARDDSEFIACKARFDTGRLARSLHLTHPATSRPRLHFCASCGGGGDHGGSRAADNHR